MFLIDVSNYGSMLIKLRVLDYLSPSTSATSLQYLRILLIIDLVFGRFISTRKLQILPRIFVYVTWIPYAYLVQYNTHE